MPLGSSCYHLVVISVADKSFCGIHFQSPLNFITVFCVYSSSRTLVAEFFGFVSTRKYQSYNIRHSYQLQLVIASRYFCLVELRLATLKRSVCFVVQAFHPIAWLTAFQISSLNLLIFYPILQPSSCALL